MSMIKRVSFLLILVLFFSGFRMGKKEVPPFNGLHPYEDPFCAGAWLCASGGANGATMTDLSGNGNTLTVAGSPNSVSTSTDVPAGFKGSSLEFLSTDTEWMAGSTTGSLDIAKDQISIAYWIKLGSATGSPIGKWAGGQEQYRTRNWNGLILRIAGIDQSVRGNNLVVGTWTHVCYTYDGASMRAYRNGEPDTYYVQPFIGFNRAVSGAINNGTDTFYLGRDGDGNYLNGEIDEVIIFNRCITQEEVQYLKNYGIDSAKGRNG